MVLLLLEYIFKWQYMAGAGAGAKLRKKVEPELVQKINIFVSATLVQIVF